MDHAGAAYHHILSDEVIDKFDSSVNGLSSLEAEQRLLAFGHNRLPEAPIPGVLAIFLVQLRSPIVYLLLGASGISFFFKDYTEAVAIFLVIIINAIIGFIMEYQAINSMDALKKLDLSLAKVYREGVLTTINTELIVPGDILYVEAGDIIAADARLIESADLQVDESPLTGESQPVDKNIDPLPLETMEADRTNTLYKGTAVTRGNGKAVVVGTAQNTELGKIAGMAQTAQQEETPLNKRLEHFSKKLVWLVVAIAFPFLIVGIWQHRDMHLMIETAIALAVAAIPEGLPIVATIALARGMLNLAKRQVIIKKLTAVETLGSANIILTDKTGTLTENKLTLHKIRLADGQDYQTQWTDHHNVSLTPGPYHPSGFGLKQLMEVSVLCNNATYHQDGKQDIGDPLEISLLKFVASYDQDYYQQLRLTSKKVDEIPFDSDAKIMGTIHQRDGDYLVSAKGAVESVLKNCTHMVEHGEIKKLDDEMKQKVLDDSEKLAAQGMKVLGYGHKVTNQKTEEFLFDLVFVGVTGFLDPPRPDIKQSLAECKNAGIKVVMITGDHFETAKEICRQVGLSDSDQKIIGVRGRNLAEMDLSDGASSKQVEEAAFFSRVTPAQKLDLVRFYQKKGYVVGMTGDGINDAPALKKAEIGIAMGIRGTQVAREAADMVLKDDAFPSLVIAIRQGRTIYNNIKNFIVYLLSCNLSEILIVAIAAFSNLALPLLPLQILFLNLVTDVFPALALGMGKGGPNIMKRPPRQMKEPLITNRDWVSISVYSVVITLIVFAVFVYCLFFLEYNPSLSNTIVFFSLSLAQLLHPLSLVPRSSSIFNNQITRNIHVWLAVIFCMVLIMGVYLVPASNQVLSLAPLSSSDWLLVLYSGVFPVVIIRALKRMKVVG